MPQIDLPYGDQTVPLAYDPQQFQVLTTASDLEAKPLSDAEIGAAIDSPIGSPILGDILNPGESVLIIVSDATRATASAQIVNLLIRRVIQNGIAPHDIAIIFATGIHRSVTPEEKRDLLTPFIVQRIRVIDHDANDPGCLSNFGTTRRGTAVELNRNLAEFDHIILTGGIGFHYFAGFTGGRKSICPGLAASQTIRETHMLALDFETGVRRIGVGTGHLEGNAVNEECEEIAGMVEISFSINAVVDDRGRAVRIYAGDWKESHSVGCREYLNAHRLPIAARRKLVVVSCGGRPYDINLIQAHKALDMAALACVEGGTIVLLAECPDGLGRADFLKWFDHHSARELSERLRTDYEVNGQTAWALLDKTERYRVAIVSSLPEEQVKQMRMVPRASLAAAFEEIDPVEGYIMPRGAALLPVPATQ